MRTTEADAQGVFRRENLEVDKNRQYSLIKRRFNSRYWILPVKMPNYTEIFPQVFLTLATNCNFFLLPEPFFNAAF